MRSVTSKKQAIQPEIKTLVEYSAGELRIPIFVIFLLLLGDPPRLMLRLQHEHEALDGQGGSKDLGGGRRRERQPLGARLGDVEEDGEEEIGA